MVGQADAEKVPARQGNSVEPAPRMPRVALVNPPLKSAVSDYGVGHQIPLGLLMIGGPLVDAGCSVLLIDGAVDHLPDSEIVARLAAFRPDIVMTAHVGATPAHPVTLRMLGSIKSAFPEVLTVYGGVHATYHHKSILAEYPQVDVIVRGEGEEVALALVNAFAAQQEAAVSLPSVREADAVVVSGLVPAVASGVVLPGVQSLDFAAVPGLAWRRAGVVVANLSPRPIEDLDKHRIAWELVVDWDRYKAFGMGRSAVVQFSRGCPHTCTYCGQWMFWRKWRHRSAKSFVDEVEWLHRTKGIRFFWLADENPTTLKDVWRDALAEIAARNLDIGWSGSMRAQDIVRDADMLELYKRAGFLYILMGIETVTDENLTRIRKGSSVDDGYRAVQLLRQHDIMSVVDYIVGIEEETPASLWRGLKGLLRYNGDFVNALYMTPHAWTPFAKSVAATPKVEADLSKWDYRHQILGVRRMSPNQLFAAVKAIEVVYHLHPRRLWRALTVRDPRLRRQLRRTYLNTSGVFFAELGERAASCLRLRRAGKASPAAVLGPIEQASGAAQ